MEQMSIYNNRFQYPIPRLPQKYLTEEGWWDDWHYTDEEPPKESGVYYAIYEWQDCYMYTYMYYDGQTWYEADTWNKEWRKAQIDPFAYVGIPSRYMQVDKGLQERFEYSVKKEVKE